MSFTFGSEDGQWEIQSGAIWKSAKQFSWQFYGLPKESLLVVNSLTSMGSVGAAGRLVPWVLGKNNRMFPAEKSLKKVQNYLEWKNQI